MDEAPAIDLNARIAQRVRELRAARGLSLDALAAHSGVSRSMISLIERAESSPTAVVLERLATGLGVTLAGLFEASQREASPLSRRAEQAVWQDPGSGYRRRNLSPGGYPSPLQLVEVHFPAGARVAYESTARDNVVHQQIWLVEGEMVITVGEQTHVLAAGDCLAMRLDQPTIFSNRAGSDARYLVALCTEPGPPPKRTP